MPPMVSHLASRISSTTRALIRPVAATFLCVLVPAQIVPAQALPAQATSSSAESRPAAAHSALPAAPRHSVLDTDQRYLHLLNRFTFGPTPADVASLHRLAASRTPSYAIDAWFEQQLKAARLPDPQLDARLAQFPAMQLPVDQLLEQFPSGAEIRQAANGKRLIPNDRVLSAVYRRHIALYEDKQAKKADTNAATRTEKANPAGKGDTMTASAPSTAGMMPEKNSADSSRQTNMAATAAPANSPAKPAEDDRMVATLMALPAANRVNRLLAMQPEEFEKLQSSLEGPQKVQLVADMSPSERETVEDYVNPSRAVIQELQAQRLLRDIYSSHQLQEVMTTFWLNHFNVYLHKNEEAPYYLVSYERDVIRPHALGNFESLLVATAQSPAMLLYLDNSSSTGPDSTVAQKHQTPMFGKDKNPAPGLNENYARELMELHTLGVNGGYTQKDVTEVAKVFTGWTVDKPQQGGGAEFDASRHQPGTKLVLGHKIKENGQKEGLQFLHTLATSPATAHFISQELAVAFVSDSPSPALVNRMAQSFLATHGDIPAVLRTMLHSPEFWSPDAYQAKVKTPLEYVVSAVRASGADVTNAQPLVGALDQMGMPLYACVPPTGYSDKADAWVSTGALVTRMNFGLTLASNRYPGVQTDWNSAALSNSAQSANPLNDPVNDPAQAEQRLETQIIPTGISEHTRNAVLEEAQNPNAAQQLAQAAKSQAAKETNGPQAGVAATLVANHPAANHPAANRQPARANGQQKAAAAQLSPAEKQNQMLAGLLIGSPEFQRR